MHSWTSTWAVVALNDNTCDGIECHSRDWKYTAAAAITLQTCTREEGLRCSRKRRPGSCQRWGSECWSASVAACVAGQAGGGNRVHRHRCIDHLCTGSPAAVSFTAMHIIRSSQKAMHPFEHPLHLSIPARIWLGRRCGSNQTASEQCGGFWYNQLGVTCCRCSGGTMRRHLGGGAPPPAPTPPSGSGLRSGQERTAASARGASCGAFAASADLPGLPPALPVTTQAFRRRSPTPIAAETAHLVHMSH